ncbi:hypothetical protein AVEN_94280-1 [Araneus ventricosus]|uniref:Retrotransposon gag domain-containing protein n=1 Tax=Araneus ventricosus TaxID=182803 RepID=A0A4Y2RW63_ARAVE|nr:hypothetical protein AVEN_94280-1 [Araneus ventricosus]
MDEDVAYICDVCKDNSSLIQDQSKKYCRVSSLQSSFECTECPRRFSMGYEVIDRDSSLGYEAIDRESLSACSYARQSSIAALAEFSRADIDESDVDEETGNDFEKENKKSDSFEGESSNKRDSSMQCEAQCNMQCDANKIYDMQFVDKCKSSVVQNTVINYSDIESAISKFNAESHENIANWLDHFENISQLFSLSDLQKFIFAKRSLGGTAALFVRTEPQINSWQKLKQALIEEFSFEINSAHLHELLSKRKMRDSESATEYFLKMKELCSSGKIEDAALMYYVIIGINDRQENKTILYGCKNLFEFKEKLKVYEVIKSDYAKSKAFFDKTKARYDSNPRFNSFDKLKPKQGHDDRFNSKNEVQIK